MTNVRGRGLRCCLAAVAALLLGGCGDGPTGGPEQVAGLEAVGSTQFAAYAATQQTVFVRAVDEDGDPVPGATVEWRVVTGGGTIGAASSVADPAGIAQVSWTLAPAVGVEAQLEASHAGADQVVFTVTTALPVGGAITATGAGQSATPLAPLAAPLVVRVALPDGRPLPGVPVSWHAPPGSPAAVVPTTTTPTNAQGEVQGTWTVPAQAGTYTVTAMVGEGAQRTAVPFTVTVVPGPPTQVQRVIHSTPCAEAGSVMSPPWGVRLLDAYNNPVSGVRVDFTATSTGSATPATVMTDANGTAVTQWRVRTTPGVDTLVAVIPSMGNTQTFLKDVCPGPIVRSELYVGGVPADTLRIAVGQQRVIQVRQFDAYGNRVPVNERKVFGWESADSAVASIIPPPYFEGDYTYVQGKSPGTTLVRMRNSPFPAGQPVLDSIVVVVSPVALRAGPAVRGGRGRRRGRRGVAGAAGGARAPRGRRTMRTIPGRGVRGWLAAAALLLGACGDGPTGPGPVAALQAVSPATFAAYAATQQTVFVRAVDAGGDPVPGATIQWRIVTGGGSIGAASSVTDGEGVAQVAWTLGTVVGAEAQMEAAHPDAQPLIFVAHPSLPPGVAITTLGAGQSAQPLAALAQPLGVRVTLPDGRALMGVPVLFTAPPGSPYVVAPTTPVPTNAQGEAHGTWSVPAQAGTYAVTAVVGEGAQRTAVPISVTVVAGAATRVEPVFYSNPCVQPGAVVDPHWGVQLFDAYNNPVPGARVDFAALGNGAATPATAATDADGRAVTQWRVRTNVSIDTLYAHVPSIPFTRMFAKAVCATRAARAELRVNGVAVDTLRLTVGEERTVEFLRLDAAGNPLVVNGFWRGSRDSAVARISGVSFHDYAEGTTAVVTGVGVGTTPVFGQSDAVDSIVVVVSAAAPLRASEGPGRTGVRGGFLRERAVAGAAGAARAHRGGWTMRTMRRRSCGRAGVNRANRPFAVANGPAGVIFRARLAPVCKRLTDEPFRAPRG